MMFNMDENEFILLSNSNWMDYVEESKLSLLLINPNLINILENLTLLDIEIDICFNKQAYNHNKDTYGMEITREMYEITYIKEKGDLIRIIIIDSSVEIETKRGTLSVGEYFELNEKEAVQLANILKQFVVSHKEEMLKRLKR